MQRRSFVSPSYRSGPDSKESVGRLKRVAGERETLFVFCTQFMKLNSQNQNKSLHILVVDDEPAILKIVAQLLTASGHIVEQAANGRLGLAMFLAGRFDLVITDLNMPKMNGVKMAEAIKETSPQTTILMLTALGQMFIDPSSKPKSIDRIMSKPFTEEDLQKAIAQLRHTNTS